MTDFERRVSTPSIATRLCRPRRKPPKFAPQWSRFIVTDICKIPAFAPALMKVPRKARGFSDSPDPETPIPPIVATIERSLPMTYHNAAAIVADTATAVVERAPLTRAFEIVTAAVDKRVTWPILDNARMQGDGSALFVTATNLDIELTVAIPAVAGVFRAVCAGGGARGNPRRGADRRRQGARRQAHNETRPNCAWRDKRERFRQRRYRGGFHLPGWIRDRI